jgi:hypothetical protein
MGDRIRASEVRDRTGHLEDAIVTSGREPEPSRRGSKKLSGGRRQCAVARTAARRHPRVEPLRPAPRRRDSRGPSPASTPCTGPLGRCSLPDGLVNAG